MSISATNPDRPVGAPMVRWRFWLYAVLLVASLLLMWWDRDRRRQELEISRAAAPVQTEQAPRSASD